jgi:hypothetical protein
MSFQDKLFQDMALLRDTLLVEVLVVHMPFSIRQHRQETLAKGTWLTIFGRVGSFIEHVCVNVTIHLRADHPYGQH